MCTTLVICESVVIFTYKNTQLCQRAQRVYRQYQSKSTTTIRARTPYTTRILVGDSKPRRYQLTLTGTRVGWSMVATVHQVFLNHLTVAATHETKEFLLLLQSDMNKTKNIFNHLKVVKFRMHQCFVVVVRQIDKSLDGNSISLLQRGKRKQKCLHTFQSSNKFNGQEDQQKPYTLYIVKNDHHCHKIPRQYQAHKLSSYTLIVCFSKWHVAMPITRMEAL